MLLQMQPITYKPLLFNFKSKLTGTGTRVSVYSEQEVVLYILFLYIHIWNS